ncbi:hypothetical protein [Mucilaginibacter phyllosphaerae]|uniref:Glycosyl transferase n=1 Tax=Mucilaginibacter phyllosphaerae TaxID=1812349 RepID=A0A4Y8AI36_9SPHI|nr:hypothetical protein [Mucilaginibacter phyllosphaerae]MBB3968554.1 hypothetical protein [Mucilaginibacter phyllosphaerae]TEW67805.1 hypothetical protein E2R65_07400 [Mucilaginibacter phyllosphaerae]GGH15277.1 hypothetical protein GCM10007352_23950 [Mucilaginibacter phyllosphaerae]
MNQPLNIITIATGKKLYVDMAANLVRSFILWNKDSGIRFYLATDLPQYLPADVSSYIEVINLQPNELGKGFSPKLHLDKIAPAGKTLFIDSDCLVYGSLLPVFEQFNGHQVSVVGNYAADGEWFGDIAAVCRQFHIPQLPKFNGGIYYLENGPEAAKVYAKARELEARYDEIGFVRLRGRPNDEVLMALAMQLHAQYPIEDDGLILAEFVNFKSGIKSDILKGTAELYNDSKHPLYQKNWHLTIAKPLIVHFLGHYNQLLPYTAEVKKLKYISEDRYTQSWATLLSYLKVTLPTTIGNLIKDMFRPVYRVVIGTRSIKPSERIIE